jgi:hypothetical protein
VDDRNPTSDRLRRLASRYEAGVGRGHAEQIAARAITRAHRRASSGRRVAVVVSSGAFLLVVMTGIGVAADRAIPGDLLYPLDRALEAVGLTSDIVEERLQEAIALIERGETELAIVTANEALAELSRSGVTVTFPIIAPQVTDEVVDEAITTTTGEIVEVAPPVTEPSDGAHESTPRNEQTVTAAAEPVDASEAIRLAAEQLLQSVRSAKSDPSSADQVTTAAVFLAEATASASFDLTPEDVADTTTTSTTTSTSTTTTTTVPDEPVTGDEDGSDEENGTTSTTVASDLDDGSGSDESSGGGEGGSRGPIFLPTP